jgi:hypothetical protein
LRDVIYERLLISSDDLNRAKEETEKVRKEKAEIEEKLGKNLEEENQFREESKVQLK